MVNPAPMTVDELGHKANVSRETLDRLRVYEELLLRWQERINLVSRDSLNDVWRRHFLDSLQLAKWVETGHRALDMGSGAGFPGMVLSIACEAPIVLAESDARKCAFLREVRRVTKAPSEIAEGRVEAIEEGGFSLILARALAPVVLLLEYAAPMLAPDGVCVFLKGARVDEELKEARASWHLDVTEYPSAADPRGVVLEIRKPERV
jgi:16S rRNA (guanine527-N7)-methyltransferase